VGLQKFQEKRKQDRLSGLITQIREKEQEDYIKNFINRFGFEGKKGKSYTFRNYSFDWDRINDLEKVLREKGVELQHNNRQKDIFTIMRYYIQNKEENLTRESIKNEPQSFAILSGSEFEKLLYRLFEAMGYKVQPIGRSGDQGGDLIANKDGERVLIQAKCYRDWSTGNAAVQQVVAAIKYYDCNKAMVVTTSRFTAEAIVLAKVNNTELIPKERLQELLLQYLKESWL
jgi:restriction system protein